MKEMQFQSLSYFFVSLICQGFDELQDDEKRKILIDEDKKLWCSEVVREIK